MATTKDFIEYVCEQIEYNGSVRYKKMFGEYMVYINEKPILLVCDNTVFVKQVDCVKDLMINAEKGYPYDGAKEHYILDYEDKELTNKVINSLEAITVVKPNKNKVK